MYLCGCVQVGDYVKLTNLHAAQHKDAASGLQHAAMPILELCLHKGFSYKRGISILDSDSPQCTDLKNRLDKISEDARRQQVIETSGQCDKLTATNHNTGKRRTRKSLNLTDSQEAGPSGVQNRKTSLPFNAQKRHVDKTTSVIAQGRTEVELLSASEMATASKDKDREDEVDMISPSPKKVRKLNRSMVKKKPPRCMQKTLTSTYILFIEKCMLMWKGISHDNALLLPVCF